MNQYAPQEQRHGTGGPTPRRLHFDTVYDHQQAFGNMRAHQALGTTMQPAQAMNPSLHAGRPHDTDAPQAERTNAATDDHDHEEDGEMTLTVDFF